MLNLIELHSTPWGFYMRVLFIIPRVWAIGCHYVWNRCGHVTMRFYDVTIAKSRAILKIIALAVNTEQCQIGKNSNRKIWTLWGCLWRHNRLYEKVSTNQMTFNIYKLLLMWCRHKTVQSKNQFLRRSQKKRKIRKFFILYNIMQNILWIFTLYSKSPSVQESTPRRVGDFPIGEFSVLSQVCLSNDRE